MVSPVINEQFYDGAFIVSMAPGDLSIDIGYIDNSTGADVLFEGGLVVVQATSGTDTTAAGTNTGNGTIGSVTPQSLAEEGVYTVTMTSATAYTVTAPSGDVVGTGVTGTAFTSTQMNLTVTAGGTAFVAGDSFTITVTGQPNRWISWTGGSITTPIGVLYNRVWVQAGNFLKVSIVRRNAEVNQSELQWDAAVTGSGSYSTLVATALAALATSNVIAR